MNPIALNDDTIAHHIAAKNAPMNAKEISASLFER
jgi:hypothetical protein